MLLVSLMEKITVNLPETEVGRDGKEQQWGKTVHTVLDTMLSYYLSLGSNPTMAFICGVGACDRNLLILT